MSNPYDYAIDPAGDATANKVLRLVGNAAQVLELGTAAGVMTRELQRQGCTITGIEYDGIMAQVAAQWCQRMIVGDLETLELAERLAGARFDVVVAADVLEHLRNPAVVLQRLHAVCTPNAALVISVPNVGYAGLVGALARGAFQYREKGLLDRTHLRFFTRNTLEWMLLETGWIPEVWDAYRVSVERSEFLSDWLRLPPAERDALLARPDGDVYQFIVRARRAIEPGVVCRLQAERDDLQCRLQALQAQLAAAEQAHQRDLADLREHQQAFSEARELIAGLQRRVAELEDGAWFKSGAWLSSASGIRAPFARLLFKAARVLARR